MRHPQLASVFSFPPPRTRERSRLTLTLTPLHSEYQGRCHGIRPISGAHPYRHASKPQGTFIVTFWRTSENSPSRHFGE
jgi:hypothetical protein